LRYPGFLKKVLFLILPMIGGLLIFWSWMGTQESVEADRGRTVFRYIEGEDSAWKQLDYAVFKILNGSMHNNKPLQTLWGLANHRACDLAAAIWMALIFGLFYLVNPRGERRSELLQFGLYIVLITLIALTLSNSKVGLNFYRHSPTRTEGIMENAVRLSEQDHIPWKVKDSSTGSMPGDHGVVLLIVGSALVYRLRSAPYQATALLGVVLFSLPRLAGGGHWASDILVGSLLYYSILFPVFMFEPLRNSLLRKLEPATEWLCRTFAARFIQLEAPLSSLLKFRSKDPSGNACQKTRRGDGEND